jgi:glyoxylase-like metal-dependent hydrolase (beta-lactamase superfamily II)
MEIISFKGGHDRNISYIIHSNNQALIIDPFKNTEIYLKKAEELNLKLIGIINTHKHIDHIEGNKALEKSGIKILDLENKSKIKLGKETIQIIKTPGHSSDCKCFLINNNLFTGDVLLAKRVGMAFTKKDTPILYKSLQKLKALPKKTIIWPGHFYNSPFPFTLKEELARNKYLQAKNLKEFTKLIDHWREYMKKRREK